MKNAMKKLTSLLLVAVLLVGAIPFAALAAEDEISFASNSEVAAASVEPAAETPAPAANAEGEVTFSSSTPVANSAQTGEPQAEFPLVINVCANAKAEYGITDFSDNVSVDANTRPGQVARDHLHMDRATWDKMIEKYEVTYSSTADLTPKTTTALVITIKDREPEEKDPVMLDITLRFNDSSIAYDEKLEEGTVLTLDDSILTVFDATLPQGQKISMFKEVIYNDGSPVGNPVVIADKYTVKYKAEIVVITVPATAGGTTTGGTTGGNAGTGSNGTTGGTTAGAYTVTFYDYDGKTVLHTATTTANGKLAAIDVNYAAKLVNAPSGYTFSDRWKKNNTGDSIATSTIISDITITANTTFVPVFTAVKNDIVTSTKNQNDIILNIFVNKDFNNCKTVKLNDHWVISDNKITTYEILNYVVTDYYKASNSNLGLQCDGLYYSVGSFMYNWLLDNAAVKTDSIDNIDVKRANGVVTINVMVTNAVAKTSTAVASDNPKTGDNIYTAMTVMGLSAASLAAVMFFYNKKRYTV